MTELEMYELCLKGSECSGKRRSHGCTNMSWQKTIYASMAVYKSRQNTKLKMAFGLAGGGMTRRLCYESSPPG